MRLDEIEDAKKWVEAKGEQEGEDATEKADKETDDDNEDATDQVENKLDEEREEFTGQNISNSRSRALSGDSPQDDDNITKDAVVDTREGEDLAQRNDDDLLVP